MIMTKTSQMKDKTMSALFVIFNIISILLLISLFFTPDWVEMNDEDLKIEFTGGLFEINEGFSSGESYSHLSEKWCNKESVSNSDFFVNQAGCALFTDLKLAGEVMLFGEIIGVVLNVLVLIFLFVYIKHSTNKTVIFAISLINLCLQVFAFLVYFFLANITFSESCENWNSNENPEQLCAKDGPIYLLSVLVYESLLFMAQISVLCYLYKKKVPSKTVIPQIDLPSTQEEQRINQCVVRTKSIDNPV